MWPNINTATISGARVLFSKGVVIDSPQHLSKSDRSPMHNNAHVNQSNRIDELRIQVQ
jgi:hypothetical protein